MNLKSKVNLQFLARTGDDVTWYVQYVLFLLLVAAKICRQFH